MTQVVVPYVASMLRPETVAAAGLDARYVALDPADDTAYAHLLCELWEAGADFSVVEHDVVPPDDSLATFDACTAGWCILEPLLKPGAAWLGCVRFRAAFMAEHPTAMVEAQSICDDGDIGWTWRRCDVRLERVLRGRHVSPCFHGPRCAHLHDPQAPPCGYEATSASPVAVYGPRTVRQVCTGRIGHRDDHTDDRGVAFA